MVRRSRGGGRPGDRQSPPDAAQFLLATRQRAEGEYTVYVSKTKIDDLVTGLPSSVWSRLSATVGLTIPPVKFDVTLRERPEKQSAVRARIEKMLRKQRTIS